MPNPLQPAFWEAERRFMWEELSDLVFDTMLEGASNGLPLLPKAIQPFVNWDTVNESALRFLRQYRSDILDGIDIVTEEKTRDIMANWLREGQPLETLKVELAPIFGSNRAAMIAQTEVTRLFAQGNMALWQSTGIIEAKVWQTARDERVCPFCGPLHNQVVDLNQNFTLSVGTVAQSPQMKALLGSKYTPENAQRRATSMLGNVGNTAFTPPYHPRCRCWLKPVVSLEMVEGRIGNVLAQQFFAQVKDSELIHVRY